MRKRRWIRQTDLTRRERYASAVIVFVAVFGVAVLLALSALADVSGRQIDEILTHDGPLQIAMILLFCAGVSYLPARFAYHRSTHRREPDPTEYCGHCGYNLTGNATGQCPECGRTRAMSFVPNSLFHGRSNLLKWVLASWIAWPVCALMWFCATLVPMWVFRYAWVGNASAVLMFVGVVASGVVAIVLALCYRRLTTGAAARCLSTAVITVATTYELAMVSLFAAGSTFPPPTWLLFAIIVTATGWFATQTGYLAMAALLAARIPAKRCAAILWVCTAVVVSVSISTMIFANTNSQSMTVQVVIAIAWFMASAGALFSVSALVGASVKLGKLIRHCVQYERTNEWPIV